MRGDMHLHSDWSGDGKHPLLDMVEAVRARGHEYMAITDHSAGVGMGIGLEADDVRRQIEAVQLIRETLDGFELLAGCEVDVMGDGSLYLPDDVLAELDWVVASLHVAQRQDSDRITKRLLAAAEHPSVDVIGHPSGRMIGKREGYAFDVEALIAACAEHGTFLEINAQPHRLDLRPGARPARARRRRQARDLDRRPPPHGARLPGARGLHGPARGRDARRHRQRASPGRAERAAQARQSRSHVSEPDRSSEGLVFVSTGRRLAAAKVGRRWHEVRGPLHDRRRARVRSRRCCCSSCCACCRTRACRCAGSCPSWRSPRSRSSPGWGSCAPPSDASCRSARRPPRPSWRRSRPCAAPLRGGFDAASAQVLAYETRERLGYAAVSVCDRERVLAHAGLGARSSRRGPARAAGRRRRDARAARLAAARSAGSTAATAATARCARRSSRRS